MNNQSIFMGPAVSVTIPWRRLTPEVPFKVGDKVRLAKDSYSLFSNRIKPKRMVHRMLKKKFKPTFIITWVNGNIPSQYSANLKPFNF